MIIKASVFDIPPHSRYPSENRNILKKGRLITSKLFSVTEYMLHWLPIYQFRVNFFILIITLKQYDN